MAIHTKETNTKGEYKEYTDSAHDSSDDASYKGDNIQPSRDINHLSIRVSVPKSCIRGHRIDDDESEGGTETADTGRAFDHFAAFAHEGQEG
mmetsp:Transcript_63785/g.101507  ORF Transcript_63785/g.101507 Transcript_63785/m.101507 type:complete len:92 (+) Transcript_63785:50-325(+)